VVVVTSPRVTVHIAPWVLTGRPGAIRHGAVAVAESRVVAVGSQRDVLPISPSSTAADAEIIEWPGTLSPGLINAHTHLQYTDMAELGRTGHASFEAWSEVFEAEYSQPHDWRQSAESGLDALIRAGTTAVCDVVTHVEALDVLRSGGLHGIAYWEVMAWHYSDWVERGRRETIEVLRGADGATVGLSPHAPYSLDTEVLRDLGVLAREHGIRSHVHLAESAWEHDYVASGSGPLADQWRRWGYSEFSLLRENGTAQRPVPYAESVGALGPDSHVAHGIYVDADDRATLRRTGTAVALCPRSNAVLGLDEAPVAAYLREGNAIAVGTDSLSSSPSLDVLADVAALYAIARRQGYAEPDLHQRLFEAVTVGGAVAMGLSGQIGVLEPGKLADMTVLDIDMPTAADTVAAVVEFGEGRAVATIIAGEVRHARDAQTSSSRSS
jgi:cytosine/adenosine deaminase-related metal-dependent hydrolase